tara:strand:+ start:106 stop:282 length:177 start_codon:yes stop_codon:yes gene_type:complete
MKEIEEFKHNQQKIVENEKVEENKTTEEIQKTEKVVEKKSEIKTNIIQNEKLISKKKA